MALSKRANSGRSKKHESAPADLFPVTAVREQLPEAQLPDLIAQSERLHAHGNRESFVWGPVDTRLNVHHEDHDRYDPEIVPALFENEHLREEVSAQLIDAVVGFCEAGGQANNDDEDDIDEALALDQDRRFAESLRRQKRLMEMPEELRRHAKPDVYVPGEHDAELNADDETSLEEFKLKEALKNFDFDQIQVPVLFQNQNQPAVVKFSEMFNPTMVISAVGTAGKSRVMFLKRRYGKDQKLDSLLSTGEAMTEDERYFPFSASVRRDFAADLVESYAEVASDSEENELDHELGAEFFGLEQFSYSNVEQHPWEASIIWEGVELHDSNEKTDVVSSKQRIESPRMLAKSGVEMDNSLLAHHDLDDHDDFKLERGVLVDQLHQKNLPSLMPSHRAPFRLEIFKRDRKTQGFRSRRLGSSNDRSQTYPSSFFNDSDDYDEAKANVWELFDQHHDSLMVSTEFSRKYPDFPVNKDFEKMEWMSTIIWECSKSRKGRLDHDVTLDLNDKNLIVEDKPRQVSNKKPTFEDFPRIASSGVELVPFNLSNDESKIYANPLGGGVAGRAEVQHAVFSKDLQDSIFKPHMTDEELRRYHRPLCTLIWFSRNREAISLKPAVSKNAKSDTKKFVPKKDTQLSAREGRVTLMEYVEERPALLNKFGMVSEVITYYRQQRGEQAPSQSPQLEDGVFHVSSVEQEGDDSLFLGEIKAGTMLTTLKNNMYVAPLFKHNVRSTDFLLISSRSKKTMYIREIPALYVAGQLQPKVEVPAPNSRSATKYTKVRLSVYIQRLLKNESKLQISAVTDAFKDQSESAIRTELKEIAEFQRGGPDSGWWTKKDDWDPPRDSELQQALPPEEVCAYESMLAGKVYLADFGLVCLKLQPKLSNFVQRLPDESPLKAVSIYIEEELQLAPWNWTSSFLLAQQGQCFLKLAGAGNPLGKGQGFSYLKQLNRADFESSSSRIAPAVSLTGTDKDLRSLPNPELEEILLSFGVSRAQIKVTPRWKRVDLVREKATDAVMMGQETKYAKYARSTRNTSRAQRKQFKKDAQKIFGRQCEVLSMTDPPNFSDEENGGLSDEDILKDLEEEMEVRSPSPGRSTKHHQEEHKEYESIIKQREERQFEATPPIESPVPVSSTRKRIIKKKLIKKTVSFVREDGTIENIVSIIDEPQKVLDFELDQKDGGHRFQDAQQEFQPPAAASKKSRKRTEPKKRRKAKEANGIVMLPNEPAKQKSPNKSTKRTAAEISTGGDKTEEEKPPSKKKAKKIQQTPPVSAATVVVQSRQPGQSAAVSAIALPDPNTSGTPIMAAVALDGVHPAFLNGGKSSSQTIGVNIKPAAPVKKEKKPPKEPKLPKEPKEPKEKKPPKDPKCGACGQIGHNRSSKKCPMRAMQPPVVPPPVPIEQSQ